MPEFEIICLANSRKRQGRCVAGIRMDGSGWIRPVAPSSEGTLFPMHYMLPDGSEAGLLDVVRVSCIKPRPQDHHPEDWLLAPNRWMLVARPAPSTAVALLQTQIVTGPAILGDTEERVPFNDFHLRPAENSLALVRPQSLCWIIKEKPGRVRQHRVAFSQNGCHYDMPLTDQNWEVRLKSLPPGTHHRKAVGMGQDEMALLTISLSEPFEKEVGAGSFCYKLVAAITIVPPDWREVLQSPHQKQSAYSQTRPMPIPLAASKQDGATKPSTEAAAAKPMPAYRVEEIRQEYERAYEPWSDREEQWLIQLFHAQRSEAQIATLLQRQVGAIRSRLSKLRDAGKI